MTTANKKVLISVWRWLKYVMIPPTLIWLCYGQLLFEFFGNNTWLLLVIGAAIFNAVMDTLAHHFAVSIFKNLNKGFWFPIMSSDSALRIGSYKVDAWHLAKSSMIVCWCFAVALHPGGFDWMDFVFAGYFYNIIFELFYSELLRRK